MHQATRRLRLLVASLTLVIVAGIVAFPSIVVMADATDTVDLHITQGIYYSFWGMYSSADRQFEQAYNASSDPAEVAMSAATAWFAVERYDSVLTWLKKVPSKSPYSNEARCLEAAVYMRQAADSFASGKPDVAYSLYARAEARLKEILDHDLTMAAAAHMLATIYAMRGDKAKADTLVSRIPDADKIDTLVKLNELLDK